MGTSGIRSRSSPGLLLLSVLGCHQTPSGPSDASVAAEPIDGVSQPKPDIAIRDASPEAADAAFGPACWEAVQEEAVALVLAASSCEAGDTCDVIMWESFLGRPGCAAALACYGFIGSRTDRAALADAARALAERTRACGTCGVAACASLAGKRLVCDATVHRCVLVEARDAAPSQ